MMSHEGGLRGPEPVPTSPSYAEHQAPVPVTSAPSTETTP